MYRTCDICDGLFYVLDYILCIGLIICIRLVLCDGLVLCIRLVIYVMDLCYLYQCYCRIYQLYICYNNCL